MDLQVRNSNNCHSLYKKKTTKTKGYSKFIGVNEQFLLQLAMHFFPAETMLKICEGENVIFFNSDL